MVASVARIRRVPAEQDLAIQLIRMVALLVQARSSPVPEVARAEAAVVEEALAAQLGPVERAGMLPLPPAIITVA
jgi:hypothetical protein